MSIKHLEVELDTEFYFVSSVREAISDFREYVTASLSIHGNRISVDLTMRSRYASQSAKILNELLNYALDLSLKTYFSKERRGGVADD